MIKVWFPKVDLHEELFKRRNPLQAFFVVLNILARNDPTFQSEVLKRVSPEQIGIEFERFLFEAMAQMIREEGQVDIEQVRVNIPLWVGKDGSPEFTAQCLGNYAQLLTYRPTPEQLERAIQIVTSPPPPRRVYETGKRVSPTSKKKTKRAKSKR